MDEQELKSFIDFSKNLFRVLRGNPKYSWFFESFNHDIVQIFFSNHENIGAFDKFHSITKSDVSRIKAYLNFIDKKALNYGKIFYSNIKDISLKRELIDDFKEMKIALRNDDIIEFGRRLSLQLENIFNFSLNDLDVYNLILSDEVYYRSVVPNWPNYTGPEFNFLKTFFEINKNTNEVEQKDLSKVSFNMKSIFLSIHFDYKVNVRNINDIYFLRNIASHRNKLSNVESNKLNNILSNFDKNYSYYYKVLHDIKNGIPNIVRQI